MFQQFHSLNMNAFLVNAGRHKKCVMDENGRWEKIIYKVRDEKVMNNIRSKYKMNEYSVTLIYFHFIFSMQWIWIA